MKSTDILKVIAQDLGSANIDELNKLLKDKKTASVKYRISGESLGHLGFTGTIKNITAEGLKVFDVNKVRLIRFEDIDDFEKAKPRAERPAHTKKPAQKIVEKKSEAAVKAKSEAFEAEDGNDGYDDLRPKKLRKKKPTVKGKSGSKFIPRG